MKKIISIVFLCFVFFILTPGSVFAVGGNTISDYAGFDKVKQDIPAVQTINTVPFDLRAVDIGTHQNTRGETVTAINQARQAAGITESLDDTINKAGLGGGGFLGIGGSGNIYTIRNNSGNVSYYYRESTDENAKAILLAHVSGDKVTIPPNGFVPKGSGSANSVETSINTERGLINAVDVSNSRAPNTTYNNLVDADQYKQNQERLDSIDTNKQKLEDLLAKQKADDAIKKEEETTKPILTAGLDTTSRAKLDQDIQNLQTEVSRQEAEAPAIRAAIERGRKATESRNISTAECPSGLFSTFDILKPTCLMSLAAVGTNIILKLSAFVLYVVGNLFDYSIEITVNSAQFIESLGVVDQTWAAVRDFLNMTFIFILVFIAWQILLGNTNYNVKNSVTRLVLVAILINFSLFATKLMVDGSNIISLNIYEAMKVKEIKDTTRGSISSRIMTSLGLSGVYNFGDAFDNQSVPGCGDVPSTIVSVNVFGTILIVITGMTFLLAAVLFLIRMLNILVLFITSPLWVWSHVIQHPGVKKAGDMWWSNMIHVMKFPILYMLMLYVSLAMFAQLNNTNAAGNVSLIELICNTAREQGKPLDITKQLPIVFNFIIVIASLIGIIKYSVGEATKSTVGGKFGSGMASKFEGFSRKITTGAAQGLYNKATTARGLATIASLSTGGALGAVGLGVTGLSKLKTTKNITQDLLHKGRGGIEKFVGQGTLTGPAWKKNAMAMLSDRIGKQKIFGETSKEMSKRITGAAAEKETVLAKVQADQLKIEDRDAWLKKNVGGNYEAYAEEKIRLIEEASIGSLRNSSSQTDGQGNPIRNSTFLRQALEDVKDGNGNVIGQRVNQDKLNRNLVTVIDAHTKDGSYTKHFGRFTELNQLGAKGRMQARKTALQSAGREAKTIEKLNTEIATGVQSLERLPSIDRADPDKKSTYHSLLREYFTEKMRIETDATHRMHGASPAVQATINAEAENEIMELKQKVSENIEKERSAIEDKIEKKEKQKEDIQKKEADKKG